MRTVHVIRFPLICFVTLVVSCVAEKDGGDSGGDSGAGGSDMQLGGNIGGSGSLSAPAGGAPAAGNSGVSADDTSDGLLPIPADQAESLLGDPATACAGWSGEAEPNSILEFVVDISGSMLKTSAGTNGASKWAVTQKALHDAIVSLPQRQPVGLSFYPNMAVDPASTPRPTSACVDTSANVSIGPLGADEVQRQRLLSALDAAQPVSLAATPTHDAYDIAIAELLAAQQGLDKYLVLITDGQPTQSQGCVGTGITELPEPAQPIVEAIGAELTRSNVQTFIVGSPGSEKNVGTNADVRDWLSAAARAGGTAPAGCSDQGPAYCHFDLSQAADFGSALSDALGSIIGSVSCDWAVPPPPQGQTIDPERANMVYDNGAGEYALVLQSKAEPCSKGWAFTDASRSKIHICKQTCDLLKGNPKARVSLVFGCTQEQITAPIQ